MAHSADVLYKTEPDAVCFSAHKMYAPSLGGIVMRKDFAPLIDTLFIGGGMVDDVERDKFLLSSDNPEHLYTKFEAGLQAWGEIIGLGAAIDWLNKLPKSAHENLAENSKKLFDFLKGQPRIHVVNAEPQTTISFYVDSLDSHLLSEALSDEGIMVRSGYFCVHYYLDHVKHYPPLVRFSLGYQNTAEQIDRVIEILRKATS
jgi:selenocysteine lyase/cysteine desulfurase